MLRRLKTFMIIMVANDVRWYNILGRFFGQGEKKREERAGSDISGLFIAPTSNITRNEEQAGSIKSCDVSGLGK
jgi:hypothetical protein